MFIARSVAKRFCTPAGVPCWSRAMSLRWSEEVLLGFFVYKHVTPLE
jgi:hypothetical protein